MIQCTYTGCTNAATRAATQVVECGYGPPDKDGIRWRLCHAGITRYGCDLHSPLEQIARETNGTPPAPHATT